MTDSNAIRKWGKALVLIGVLAAFLLPTLIAIRYVALWQIYRNSYGQ